MTKLDMLNAQRAEKFAALCALVARDLGYGELQDLSEEDRNHIAGEAKHYVALWGETLEMKTSPTFRLMTPLRRLLAEYHDTCEKILDEARNRGRSLGLQEANPGTQATVGVLLAADETPRQRASASVRGPLIQPNSRAFISAACHARPRSSSSVGAGCLRTSCA